MDAGSYNLAHSAATPPPCVATALRHHQRSRPTTTHRQLSDEELAAAGIGPGTIRLSVGLEDLADLLADLDRGLVAAAGAATDTTALEAGTADPEVVA